MAREFWKVAPGSDAWAWDRCHDEKCIAINWLNDTDFTDMSKDDLKKALIDAGEKKGGVPLIWYFVHDIHQEDVIVANNASSGVVGIGVVKSDYLVWPLT